MNKVNNRDMPASPLFDRYGHCTYAKDDRGYTTTVINSGLSKREAFAMAAMQGMIARLTETGMDDQHAIDGTVEMSVRMADALLKELSNVQT